MPTFADDIRELARRMTHVEERSARVENRTDERHAENQASTEQLSNDFHQMRETMEAQAREAAERWERVDRFMDDWEGRPQEGKIGLSVQLRSMLKEWGQLRWGARVVWAATAMMASAIGYLVVHFLESHK